MKITNFSLPFLGFLQATGLLIYIGLVAQIFIYGNKIFGPVFNFIGPLAFLLLFVISAIISGFLVLARALYLFWEKRYRQSFALVGWTLLWLIFYLAVSLLFLMTINSKL